MEAISKSQGPDPQARVFHGTGYLRFVSATTGRVFQVRQTKVRRVREQDGFAVVELVDGLTFPTKTPWQLWCSLDCFAREAKEVHPHFLRRSPNKSRTPRVLGASG